MGVFDERRKWVRRLEDVRNHTRVCPISFEERDRLWKRLDEERREIGKNRKLNVLILFVSIVNFITSFYLGG